MIITLKDKQTLIAGEFNFKCCIGKNGRSINKKEGDLKTPRGMFDLGDLYFRADREKKPESGIKCIKIKKNTICCNDLKSKKYYNKILNKIKNLRNETLYRKDYKYNFVLPIKHNSKKNTLGNGSCIFIHLTNNYIPTSGCIALKKKDFLILLKIINSKTKILIK